MEFRSISKSIILCFGSIYFEEFFGNKGHLHFRCIGKASLFFNCQSTLKTPKYCLQSLIKVSMLVISKCNCYIIGSLLGETNFACNFCSMLAISIVYFLQFLMATLSFQPNSLASYHAKSFINNALSLCIFHMKMLQMFLDALRSITTNIPVYI